MNRISLKDLDGFFRGALNNLGSKRDAVNKLNVFPVPDGDTGTNMYLTLKTAVEEIDKRQPKTMRDFGKAICEGALIGGRGNSGVITSQVLKGFFEVIDSFESLDTFKLAEALANAAKVAYSAVIKPVEGTMLTVIKSMANKAVAIAPLTKEIEEFFEQILEEGKITLEKTPDMLSVLKEAGVVDAGGQGLIYVFEGGLFALKGLEIAKSFEETISEIDSTTLEGELEFKFDTVILARDLQADASYLQQKLTDFGDSIVVAQAGDLTKIHVHSNEPYRVVEEIMRYGTVTEARIENMQLEQEEFLKKKKETKPKVSKFPFSIVAVVQGEGFKEILENLGADFIIEGGQTMNPSINDFMKCLNDCTKREVMIFPNNSNVILAAKEAKKLATDKHVEVIPTVSMVQAVPAMLALNPDISFEENCKHAAETVERIHSILVTYSIRDTKINGLMISAGDVIGMFDDSISAKGAKPEEVAIDVLKVNRDVVTNASFIAVYYGKDVNKGDAETLVEQIQKEFPELEADLTYGGQPFYYYLISIE